MEINPENLEEVKEINEVLEGKYDRIKLIELCTIEFDDNSNEYDYLKQRYY